MKDVFVYENFTGSFLYSSKEKKYHGKIDGINDQIIYHADSILELGNKFEKAVQQYLESKAS
jgi:predicted HicB family RNase H-like nuclease